MDAKWYHDRALAWSAGETGSDLDVFRAPFYPMVLGGLYTLFGPSPFVPAIFHTLLGIGSVLFLFGIGDRVFGRATALTAAMFAVFYYPFAYFEGELLVTTFFIFLSLFGLFLLILAPRARSVTWLAAGLVMGAAAITRPTVLAFYPLILLWFLFHHRSRGVPLFFLLIAGLAALPIAVAARNRVLHGDFQVASQGGINLYIGNNPTADGKTATVPGWGDASYETPEYEDNVSLAARRIAERDLNESLRPGRVSRYWVGKAVEWMRVEPRAALSLLLTKAYYLLNNHEIPNNSFVRERVKEYAPLLLCFSIPAGILIALGTAGLLLPGGRRDGRELLALFLGVQAAILVLFFVCSRFRVPIMPLWILFAAHLSVRLFRERRRFPFARTLPVALPIFAITFTGWFHVREVGDMHVMHFSRAYAFAQAGDLERAEEEYRTSLEWNRETPKTWINLGGVIADRGRPEEAEAYMMEAIGLDRSYAPFVWNNLGYTSVLRGDWQNAARCLEKAIEADPDRPDAYGNLGGVLIALDRPEEALERFDEAVRRGSARGEAIRYGRAMALSDLGRTDEAVDEAAEAARVAPGSTTAWAVLAEVARRGDRGAVCSDAMRKFFDLAKRPPERKDLPEWWREDR